MRYGFAKDDSFIVVDDEQRVSEFAFASSPYWEDAKKDPEGTAKRMLSATWKECPDHLREEHYALGCDPDRGIGPAKEVAK